MFSENRSYDGTHEQIYGACIKAISNHGWNITRSDKSKGILLAITPMSLMSWGEEIKIELNTFNKKIEIKVRSESRQFIDWGKNSKNVNNFYSTIENILFISN